MLYCCVPYCKNTSKTSKTISFHGFPTKPFLRANWLKLLNKKEGQISGDSVVCSEHFLFTDFYVVDGVKKLWYDALPTAIQACIICLKTDCKLISISQYKLKQLYEDLTGLTVCKDANLCVECSIRLINFKKFKDKSLRASSLIAELTEKHKILRKEYIQAVNRDRHQLASSLVRQTFKPNHCDLFVVEYAEGDSQIELLDHINDTEVTAEDDEKDVFFDNDSNNVKFKEIYGESFHDYVEVQYIEDNEQIVHDYVEVNAEVSDETNGFDNKDNFLTVYTSGDSVWPSQSDDTIVETGVPELISEERKNINEELTEYEKAFRCTICNEVFVDIKSMNVHVKHCHSDKSNVKISKSSHDGAAQIFGLPHDKSAKFEEIYLYQDNVVRQHDKNYNDKVKIEKFEGTSEKNDTSVLYSVNDDTYIFDNSHIKTEDGTYKRVLAYNVNTGDVIDYTNINDAEPKVVDSKSDHSLRVLAYDVNSRNNSNDDHKSTETDKKTPNTKQRLILSYDENTDNIVIDTIQTNISENDVFLDKINFDEQICSNQSDLNNLDVATVNTEVTDDGSYCCHICSKTFETSDALQDHMKVHTGRRPFACRFCNFRSTHRGSLQRHEMSHKLDEAYHCRFCSSAFSNKKELINHLKKHTIEKPYSCGVCHREFVQKGNLLTHMKIHTGEKPYACKYCDFKCIQRRSLVEHSKIHASDKAFKCGLCDFNCSSRNLLVKHWKIHAGESASVEVIKKQCDTADPAEKIYMCKMCVKPFANKYNYKAHMNMHTGENMFACHYCGKKFAIKGNLVFHLRTHTGEKPFTCEICHYKFSTSTNFKRHWKIHTGEKPHACPLCPYKSIQSNDIRSHMKSHTGEKPFSCELCDYRCRERRTLRNHMRMHTGEPPMRAKAIGAKPEEQHDVETSEVQDMEENYMLMNPQ